jgi:hypothetical protein
VFRLLLWAIAAIFRPKTLLIAENLCLRQQLLVLQRRYPRRGLAMRIVAFGYCRVDGLVVGVVRSAS